MTPSRINVAVLLESTPIAEIAFHLTGDGTVLGSIGLERAADAKSTISTKHST